ncbi:peptidylprolyl isomerase [Fibrella arboris]|uniref:peptidylprolyl isomerase n=1 Tax=Fibrella arboris TaxID=3242486 RepID=UPI003522A2D5
MRKILLFVLLLPLFSLAQNRKGAEAAFGPKKKKDYLVTLTTSFGLMHFILHDDTPKHKANFIRLVDSSYYDGLLFHRIIERFMIQGGDPDSRTAVAGQPLGNGDIGYLVPAELTPSLYHKRGAIGAARNDRPDRASSAVQFYMVQGRVWNEEELQKQIDRGRARGSDRTLTDEQRQAYKTIGGTPHLDGNYTVFGQVIDGLAVIDSIAKQPRNPKDRPLADIRMTMKGEWMKKKKITKKYGYAYP